MEFGRKLVCNLLSSWTA